MHDQPSPTEEEQEQTTERLPDEEPERDPRSAEEGDTEEPVHEA
jgi:hypothetical protein